LQQFRVELKPLATAERALFDSFHHLSHGFDFLATHAQEHIQLCRHSTWKTTRLGAENQSQRENDKRKSETKGSSTWEKNELCKDSRMESRLTPKILQWMLLSFV
jgi:hypothetical protein